MDHSSRKHALLSASGASRWMNCTPSPRLEEKFEEKTSDYAKEGTLAHEYSDVALRFKLGEITAKVLDKEWKKLKKDPLWNDEIVTESHKYIELVMETYNEVKTKHPDAIILIEERLDFSHIVENGFGTGDVTIIADGTAEIIDLKYGKGVKVSAENNAQLKLYAVGAVRKYELLYDIKEIKMTIVQPRLDNYSSATLTVEELEAWAENEVKPKAQKAYIGEGEQNPGDWCKFCKAKAVCRALQEKSMEMAKHDFRDPFTLSDEEILNVHKVLPIFLDWAKSIEEHIKEEALNGKVWPGYKLVEGTTKRRWSEEEKVKGILSKWHEEDKYLKKDLKSITDITKLMGKEFFDSNLKSFVVKPDGPPTLVPENDKRPALGIESLIQDFS